MEVVELSQKEIKALITFIETYDVEKLPDIIELPELIRLHAKLRESQIF